MIDGLHSQEVQWNLSSPYLQVSDQDICVGSIFLIAQYQALETNHRYYSAIYHYLTLIPHRVDLFENMGRCVEA